jgi:hypothetical protein
MSRAKTEYRIVDRVLPVGYWHLVLASTSLGPWCTLLVDVTTLHPTTTDEAWYIAAIHYEGLTYKKQLTKIRFDQQKALPRETPANVVVTTVHLCLLPYQPCTVLYHNQRIMVYW